ncbi:unnamed protein product [Effrenium voratum]|nr:unnamed protein product [Effrenium voratum]
MHLVARARQAAAVAASAASAAASAAARSAPAESPLEQALRRVTHTDCAAIPAEDLRVAVSMVSSEEALAHTLRHIQDNVSAPAAEWRRINGALALFEALAYKEGDLGRSWFEVKMENRLKELQNFSHEEDPRVALLIRRAANSAAQAAATLRWEDDVLLEEAVVDLETGGEAGARVNGEPARGSSLNPAIIGRRTESMALAPPKEAVSATVVQQDVPTQRFCCCRRRPPQQELPKEPEEGDNLLQA